MSRQEEDIAKVQGFIVFVKGAQTGQKIKVRVTKVGSRFAIGEPVQSQDNNSDNPIQEELEQQKNNEDYPTEPLGEKQSSEE